MKPVASFEKVSLEEFTKEITKTPWNIWLSDPKQNPDKVIKDIYDQIQLPKRSTSGSAGYDFYMPFACGEKEIVIPTGIRCKIDEGWMLTIVPRSGLGFKYGMELANTVGIIDSDYYYAENEGHIMVKLRYKCDNFASLKQGDRFVQGIFLPYGIAADDTVDQIRVGGFGSTGI